MTKKNLVVYYFSRRAETSKLFSIPTNHFVFDKTSEAAVRNAKARALSGQKPKNNQGE
ncbi:MAG: hypothetical protein IIX02_02575 [Clostridia bacterium]|nr:hypothetical protein [Clostridia bacterium]